MGAIRGESPPVGLARAEDWPGPLIFVLVAGAYAGLSHYVLWLNDPVNLGAGFWPGAGLVVGALLLLPTRRWLWVLGAVAFAEMGLDLAHGYPLAAALLWTAGNVVGPLTGASLVRRFVHPRGALVPVRALLGFVGLGVILGSLVGASIGSIGTVAIIGRPVAQVWPKYVVGDALGVLVTAPLLLTWHESRPRRHLLESVALILVVTGGAVLTFGVWDISLAYLLTPLLFWVGLRFGIRETAWTVAWVAHVANWATASGRGPFTIGDNSAGEAITLLQLFVAIAAVTAFIVAALVSDLRRRAEAERSLEREAQRLREAIGRKATGLAVHDKVVQLLATASMATQMGDHDAAAAAMQSATEEAQLIVRDLLADMATATGGVRPGDLVIETGPSEDGG